MSDHESQLNPPITLGYTKLLLLASLAALMIIATLHFNTQTTDTDVRGATDQNFEELAQ